MFIIFFNKLKYFRIIFFILYILLISGNVYSLSPVTLLQGRITDKATGQPVRASIKFYSLSGKQADSKSSTEGTYQQVLTPGETYFVVFKDYFPFDKSFKLSLPESSTYNELSRDFTVVKLSEGMELYKFNAFDANSSKLSEQAISKFKELKYFLEFNSKVNLKITLSSADSKQKNTSKKSRSQSIFSDITKSRIESISQYFASNGIPLAHQTFEESKKSFDVSKSKDKKKINVIISVGRILDL